MKEPTHTHLPTFNETATIRGFCAEAHRLAMKCWWWLPLALSGLPRSVRRCSYETVRGGARAQSMKHTGTWHVTYDDIPYVPGTRYQVRGIYGRTWCVASSQTIIVGGPRYLAYTTISV